MADETPQRKRWFMPLVRALHIYLSLLALVAILAFAATGLLMNHKEQLKLEEPADATRTAQIRNDLLKWGEIDEAALVAELRTVHGLRGTNEPMVEEPFKKTVCLSFHLPGRQDDVEIRAGGEMTITTSTYGVLGELNDLHTGRYARSWWRWGIDAAAVSLLLVTLTGLVLWFSLPRRRVLGAVMLLLGLCACVVVYFTSKS